MSQCWHSMRRFSLMQVESSDENQWNIAYERTEICLIFIILQGRWPKLLTWKRLYTCRIVPGNSLSRTPIPNRLQATSVKPGTTRRAPSSLVKPLVVQTHTRPLPSWARRCRFGKQVCRRARSKRVPRAERRPPCIPQAVHTLT